MAYKGKTTVATSKLLSLAVAKGALVETTSGYHIVTKPGDPSKQVLVERFVKKGAAESATRWVELRGKGKVPFLSSSPGVVPHDHSSPSIKARLDTDVGEDDILASFALLIDELVGEQKGERQAA